MDWPRRGSENAAFLEVRDPSGADSLGSAVLARGVDALARTGHGAPEVVYAPDHPVLEDVVALWHLRHPPPSGSPPAGDRARALSTFGRLCRQGLLPGTAPVDRNPRSVFEEIKRRFPDLTDETQAAAFVERSFALLALLLRRMREGADLFGPHLFDGTTEFQEEIAFLRRDREVYAEDRARGRVFRASLTQGERERSLDLLVLESPASNRFADWARTDPNSPTHHGFALLLVRWSPGNWVLSSDPARRIEIGDLARFLDEAETRKRGAPPRRGDPDRHWYDGRRHRGTLVASPSKGTSLTGDEILETLGGPLRLRPAGAARGRDSGARPWRAAALAAALLALVAGGVWTRGLLSRSPASPDGFWREPRLDILRSVRVPGEPGEGGGGGAYADYPFYRRSYALVIGINDYKDRTIRRLDYAVDDAEGVARVLRERYGFDDATITTLFDREATRDAILAAFSRLAGILRPDDSLVVFWAGHGTAEDLPDSDRTLGYLIPYDGTFDEASALSRNITMRSLSDEVLGIIDAKHKLLIIDACYGGIFTQTRGVRRIVRRTPSYIRKIATRRATWVLTAGDADETVLDGGYAGHSVFTGHLIRILEETRDFVLASEIAVELRRSVSRDAEERGHPQNPGAACLRGSGDYIFVPKPGG